MPVADSHFMIPFKQALRDPNILGSVYGNLKSRRNWEVIGAAMFAESPERGDLEIFKQLTGRQHWPSEPSREIYQAIGRRGGKSSFSAAVGVYIATMADYSSVLAPGEMAHVVLLAVDREQAKVLLGYIKAYFSNVEMLKQLVVRETINGVELSNGVAISVHTSSFRSIRGRTEAAIVCDEFAYWPDDDASELLAAVRPGMTTIPWAMLIGISTKYMQSGPFYEEVTSNWGKDDSSTLIVQATSQQMNPTLPDDVIQRALAQDPERAGAEYLNEWRTALANAFARDKVCAVLSLDDKAIALPEHHYWDVFAYVDPSGGVNDAATLTIVKTDRESDIITVLLTARWPAPHSPASVIAEMAEVLKRYRLTRVVGDGYAAQLIPDLFADHGIHYERSEFNKSKTYLELLPLVMAEQIEGPNNETLRRELLGLQRRPRAGGNDVIDHAPGTHDDMANSFAGACVVAWHARAARFEGVVLGAPTVSALFDGGLVDDFSGSWPRLSNDW